MRPLLLELDELPSLEPDRVEEDVCDMPPYTFGLRGWSGILPPDDGPVLVVDEPCIRFLRAPSFSASNRCTWTDRGMTALMGAVLYCAVLCCAVARRFAFVPLCRLFGIITFDFESEMMGLAVLFPAPIPLSDLNAVPSQSHTHTPVAVVAFVVAVMVVTVVR